MVPKIGAMKKIRFRHTSNMTAAFAAGFRETPHIKFLYLKRAELNSVTLTLNFTRISLDRLQLLPISSYSDHFYCIKMLSKLQLT